MAIITIRALLDKNDWYAMNDTAPEQAGEYFPAILVDIANCA